MLGTYTYIFPYAYISEFDLSSGWFTVQHIRFLFKSFTYLSCLFNVASDLLSDIRVAWFYDFIISFSL